MRRASRAWWIIKALLAACALGGGAAAATPPSWCVAVWHPSSEDPGGAASLISNSDVIDIVYAFWYTPDAEGRLRSQAPANWREQVNAWREAGLIVMPSVFATHSGFMADDLRQAHIDELVALVDAEGFDGLDIDYEMFPLETKEAFTSFARVLGAALHERGKLLSITVHAKSEADPPHAPSAAAQDWPSLAAAADMINVMTYDYTNRNEPPGPVAPRSWVQGVVAYGLDAVGAERFSVGLPFYGYSWKRGRPPGVTTTFEATERLLMQFQLTPEREPDSAELEVELNVTGLPRQTVFVSDGATTAARLEALEAAGQAVAGVAIWGVGGEDPAAWDALRTARPASCALGADRSGSAGGD